MVKIENLPEKEPGACQPAVTLLPSYIHSDNNGWKVAGEVHSDYFFWINDFVAVKGKWKVEGNLEREVYATSQEAYDDFIRSCPPRIWDYWDV